LSCRTYGHPYQNTVTKLSKSIAIQSLAKLLHAPFRSVKIFGTPAQLPECAGIHDTIHTEFPVGAPHRQGGGGCASAGKAGITGIVVTVRQYASKYESKEDCSQSTAG